MSRMTEKKIGVLIITSLFHPFYGGAEKQLERLAQALSSRGVKCYILTRRLDNLKPYVCLNNNVPVYRVLATRISSGLLSSLTFIMSSCAFFIRHTNVTRTLSVLQADSDSPGIIAIIIGKLLRKKVIIRLRGTRQLEEIKGSSLVRTIFRVISKCSDAITVQYNHQVSDLKLLGVDDSKIFVIPNGVDAKYFKKRGAKNRKTLRNKIGYTKSIIGLYTGRLDPDKGLGVLIRSFARVIKTSPELKLIIVGSGSYEDRLRDLGKNLQVDKHILFVGATHDVKKYYEIADVFVLPSRSEGISNALLEAMSMELPVIATAVGGTPEVVENMYNGCLVSPSCDDIAEKLKLLIANRAIRNRLGRAARKTVVSSFSMEKTADEYIKLYAPRRR